MGGEDMGNGMGDMDMPTFGDEDEMMTMGGGDEMGGDDAPNKFDTDFDAGVEADEDEDPKRYIQQLTGKLSQSLRQYNNGLPKADADLNKYVAGMINSAAVEGLSSDDVKSIQDGVVTDNDGNDSVGNEKPSEEPEGGDMEMPPMDMPNESIFRGNLMSEEELDEIVNSIISKGDTKREKPVSGNKSLRTKPFRSPSFLSNRKK